MNTHVLGSLSDPPALSTATKKIRVLCVDDHSIVREGIALIINRQPDMEVVASAASGEESVELFRRLRPDVTLMDLRLQGLSGTDAIVAIRRLDGNARIVVLTMFDGDEDIHRALQAGAATYLLKDTLSDDLIRVVREVHSGKRPVRADVEARLAERSAHPTLTPREVQVMELVTQGLRNKEIAASLGISEGTVQVHVKSIFAKLGVNDRTAAVKIALRRGIVHMA
jgi:DNA-binding NarL/FixJ family response regulator